MVTFLGMPAVQPLQLATPEDKHAEAHSRAADVKAIRGMVDQACAEGDGPGCTACFLWLIRRGNGHTVLRPPVATGAATTAALSGECCSQPAARATPGQPSALSAMFGKPAAARAATARLESARACLADRAERLQKQGEGLRGQAVDAHRRGERSVALRLLRRAKAVASQQTAAQQALEAVEAQADLVEQAEMQKELAAALGQVAKSVRGVKDTNIVANTERAIDTASEMRDVVEDMNAVLGEVPNSLGVSRVDDDELLEELDALVGESGVAAEATNEVEQFTPGCGAARHKRPDCGTATVTFGFPSVPAGRPRTHATEDADDQLEDRALLRASA